MNRAVLCTVLLLAAVPAAASDPRPGIVGRPVVALVEDSGLATLLRQASGGRQGIVSRRLRNPGQPLMQAEDGWVYGWTCAPRGCGHEDLFIAWQATEGRIAFMLVDEGTPVYAIPPRGGAWPRALEAPVTAFRAALAGG